MVLSDNEIKAALYCKQLVIEPFDDESRISSTAVDLTLGGDEFKRWNDLGGGDDSGEVELIIDPSTKDFFRRLSGKFLVDAERERDGSVILAPHAFLLALTKENVTLPKPSRLAGRVEGRSSLARIGLGIHVTAPTIHAGWSGQIALEIVNHGCFKIRLRPGLVVCQLILEQVHGTPGTDTSGQFQQQNSVTGRK